MQQIEPQLRKKEWYVFDEDHHIGPFAVNDIIELYKANRLDTDDLVWKRGREDWQRMKECQELYSQLEPLDSAIRDIENKNVGNIYMRNRVAIEQEESEIHEFIRNEAHHEPPPHPYELDQSFDDEDFITPQKAKNQQLKEFSQAELTAEEFYGDVEILKEKVSEPPPVKVETVQTPEVKVRKQEDSVLMFLSKLSLGVVTVVALFAIGFYFVVMNKSTLPEGLNGIRQVDYLKMKKIMAAKGTESKYHFALTDDSQSIWMAMNNSGPMKVQAIFKSIRKKSLSTDGIVFQTSGVLEHGRVHFDEILFHEGNEIKNGHYQVFVKGQELGLSAKWHELKGDGAKLVEFESNAFLSTIPKKEFNQKLIDYWDKIIQEQQGPLQDIAEKYNTLGSLVTRMYEKYRYELDKVKSAAEVIRFKAFYLNQIRPVLQSITLDNTKIKVSLGKIRPLTAQKYQGLIDVGRDFGELAMDMIVKTEAMSKYTDKNKTRLRSEFRIKYENIKSKINDESKAVNELIDSI